MQKNALRFQGSVASAEASKLPRSTPSVGDRVLRIEEDDLDLTGCPLQCSFALEDDDDDVFSQRAGNLSTLDAQSTKSARRNAALGKALPVQEGADFCYKNLYSHSIEL